MRFRYATDTIDALHASRRAYRSGIDRSLHTPQEWRALGDMLNAPSTEKQAACESFSDILPITAADCVILSTDSNKRGILRVKQKAMRVDAINKNKRLYPRNVTAPALSDAMQRAQQGVMLSNWRHPEVAFVNGKEEYIDRPEDRTAFVDEIHPIDADGWVWITRTICDTPRGRDVADRIRARNPFGISTRFKLKGDTRTVGDSFVFVPDWMFISTWDDVENPAVEGAGEYLLLTDEVLKSLLATNEDADEAIPENSPGSLFAVSSAPITRADSAQHTQEAYRMKPKVARAYSSCLALISTRAEKARVFEARTALSRAIADAVEENPEDVKDVEEMSAAAAKCDSMMASAGYRSDSPDMKLVEVGKTEGGYNSGINGDEPKVETRDTKDRLMSDSLSPEEVAEFRRQREAQARAAADAELDGKIEQILAKSDAFNALPNEHRVYIKRNLREKASGRADVDLDATLKAECDAIMPIVARERLAERGVTGGTQQGSAIIGAAGNMRAVSVRPQLPAYMETVDKLLAASDEWRKRTDGFDPNSVKRLRNQNYEKFIAPMIEEHVARHKKYRSPQELFAAEDACYRGGEKAFSDALFGEQGARAMSDETLVATMYNQPAISLALLIQSFWEMTSLDFVDGIGPGLSGDMGGWVETGNSGDGFVPVYLRIPVEYYEAPTGYGTYAGPQYDAGLKVPEKTAIPQGVVKTAFLPFAASWRRIGMLASKDVIHAMGRSGVNYPVVGRHLYHIAADKSRRIDKANFDEMLQASSIYGATRVQTETASAANNTAYASGGSVVCNLNPTKTAAAAVTATDLSVTYGTNVVGAVRLKAAGNGTSSPYFGSADGPVPIVRPWVETDLNASGQVSNTTKMPLTISAPGSMIEGYIDENGNIQNFPGGGTATYAVDFENGVIVFKSGAVTGTTTISTTVTISEYWYETNYDNFVVVNPSLATGETPMEYYSRLLAQFDVSAARMSSAPRYSPPNMALMSYNAATWLTQAHIFYKFNSPQGSDYFPTEQYFFERNGVRGAQHNSPWRCGDNRVLLGKRGATKYGIECPFEIEGPYPAYDTNGEIVDAKVWYGSENSVTCTPQVRKQDGTTYLNPPYRSILLRTRVQ